MTTAFLYDFISRHKYAVLSTVTAGNKPEAALVGFAVTPDLKLIFDTVTTSRKYRNLLQNPSIALVIGWESEQTIQYEGIAGVGGTEELEQLLPAYFEKFPEGRDRKENWKDIVYFCVLPKWIRYSDFTGPVQIEEMGFSS
jgi:uncharacterized pyridoxamine 5'-phosphate oxidase family protein